MMVPNGAIFIFRIGDRLQSAPPIFPSPRRLPERGVMASRQRLNTHTTAAG